MPSARTHLGEVVYHVEGEGQPIIMLPATLHDRHDFDGIIPSLAKKYRTIALDWPGHGESKALPDPKAISAVAVATTLVEVMGALSLPPAFFIGNSVGGFAAARLAITHPQYVRGLILVNNGGFFDFPFPIRLLCRQVLGTPSITRRLYPSVFIPRYMAPQTELDAEITRRAVERARTAEGAAIVAAMWSSFPDSDADLRGRAKEIKTPTLITCGTRDFVYPSDGGKEVQKHIAGSKLVNFDCGHVVFSSKPEEFLSVVEPFLESVLAGNSSPAR